MGGHKHLQEGRDHLEGRGGAEAYSIGQAQKEMESSLSSAPMSVVAEIEKTKAPQRWAPGIDDQKGPSLRAERSVRKPCEERRGGKGGRGV